MSAVASRRLREAFSREPNLRVLATLNSRRQQLPAPPPAVGRSLSSILDRYRFVGSDTSFVDVSRYVSGISQYPITGSNFCEVYTAQMGGTLVALKKVRILGNFDKGQERLRYEAKIWKALDHPHVLPFFGICQSGHITYMTSAWQYNGDMATYLKAHPDADCLLLLTQVADALIYLHEHDPPIIHGDIKGANVLISERGDVLLCDFGLSIVISEIAFLSGISESFLADIHGGGSLRYMAPELLYKDDGIAQKTTSSDAYAFSMLMIEVLTGDRPFARVQTGLAVIAMVAGGTRPERLYEIFDRSLPNERLWRLMELCWHDLPTVRPSMKAIQELLGWIRAGNESVSPNSNEVSNHLLDVLNGGLSMVDYTQKLLETAVGEIDHITSQSAQLDQASRPSKLILHILLDAAIIFFSACQISVCALLSAGSLNDATAIDRLVRGLFVPLGICTCVWILLAWGPLELFVYWFIRTTASEHSQLFERVSIMILRLRNPFMVVIWGLSTADAALISILLHEKRHKQYMPYRKLTVLLHLHEAFGWSVWLFATLILAQQVWVLKTTLSGPFDHMLHLVRVDGKNDECPVVDDRVGRSGSTGSDAAVAIPVWPVRLTSSTSTATESSSYPRAPEAPPAETAFGTSWFDEFPSHLVWADAEQQSLGSPDSYWRLYSP